jgi:hypothetical protein
MIWIIVTALGTVGYSTVDNAAADLVLPGPKVAVRYGIYEFTFSSLFCWLLLKALRQSIGDANGRHSLMKKGDPPQYPNIQTPNCWGLIQFPSGNDTCV